jgi:N-acetylneuraminic acid mutarotase
MSDLLFLQKQKSSFPVMYQWKKIDFRPAWGPRPIYYHAGHTSHVVGNQVIVFLGSLWLGEGTYSGITNAIYIYNIKELTAWEENHDTDPSPRTSHVSVCIGKSVYLFGGYPEYPWLSNDLWCYDFEGGGSPRCIHSEGDIPMPRRYHVMTHHGGCLYVFGGETSQGSVHDFHRYDILKNTWKEIHSKESPLARRDSTIETVKNMLWLFGGTSPRNIFNAGLNDLWRFDVNCMEWDQICYSNGAFPCTRAGMTSCVIDSSIYYFGGYRNNDEPCNELWEFQTETYTWRLLNIPNQHGCVPIPRYWHSMCVSNENEIFVIGGYAGGYLGGYDWKGQQKLNDFWAISPHLKVQYIQVEIMKSGWKFTNALFKWDESGDE